MSEHVPFGLVAHRKAGSVYMKKMLLALMVVGGLLVGNLVWAPRADADPVVVIGKCVEESEVRRCVWVNYDAALGVFRARAQIEDTSHGVATWNVAVHSLELCSGHGCSTYGDYDRWHEVSDDVHSSLGSCATGRRLVWVWADFSWTNAHFTGSDALAANGYVC